MLLRIEGGRVVLEMLNQCSRLGSFIKDFRLALIDAATAAHRSVPWLGEIHGCRGSSSASRSAAAAMGGATQRSPSATGRLAEREAEYNRHSLVRRLPQRRCVEASWLP